MEFGMKVYVSGMWCDGGKDKGICISGRYSANEVLLFVH
jgi:predicted NAD/FAD-dependent oxidoreductase